MKYKDVLSSILNRCKRKKLYMPKHCTLDIYFGVPGSGKTTFAAYLAKRHLRRGGRVYSNVPITGTLCVNAREDFGTYMIRDGLVIIDEAGIEFNNREYKSFSQKAIKFFKYHRHYKVKIAVFSQSFEDMDITLRRLAQSYHVVKKSILPLCITIKRVKRKVGVDEHTHQIIDHYSFGLPFIDTKWVFSPFVWKLFNSYSHERLPEKEWGLW